MNYEPIQLKDDDSIPLMPVTTINEVLMPNGKSLKDYTECKRNLLPFSDFVHQEDRVGWTTGYSAFTADTPQGLAFFPSDNESSSLASPNWNSIWGGSGFNFPDTDGFATLALTIEYAYVPDKDTSGNPIGLEVKESDLKVVTNVFQYAPSSTSPHIVLFYLDTNSSFELATIDGGGRMYFRILGPLSKTLVLRRMKLEANDHFSGWELDVKSAQEAKLLLKQHADKSNHPTVERFFGSDYGASYNSRSVDKIVDDGFYCLQGFQNGVNGTLPGNGYGYSNLLVVRGGDQNRCFQLLAGWDDSMPAYIRYGNTAYGDGNWTAWHKIMTDDMVVGKYLASTGGTLTGDLNLTQTVGEGGQINMYAAQNDNTHSGIVADTLNGDFRIFGIPSRDGSTVRGVGTPLIINPYNKTVGTSGAKYTYYGGLYYCGSRKVNTYYRIGGQICDATNGSAKGYGSADIIIMANGLVMITYTYKITALTGNNNYFDWGLSATRLKVINSNLPTITPVAGGLRYGTHVIEIGYGETHNISSNTFWVPSRVYTEAGGNGSWPTGRFAVGDVISGICYGTYAI